MAFDPMEDIRVAIGRSLREHGVVADYQNIIDDAVDALPDYLRGLKLARIHSADFEPEGLSPDEMVLSLVVEQSEVSAGRVAWCNFD